VWGPLTERSLAQNGIAPFVRVAEVLSPSVGDPAEHPVVRGGVFLLQLVSEITRGDEVVPAATAPDEGSEWPPVSMR